MLAITAFLVILTTVALISNRLVDGPVTPPAILVAAGLLVALVSGDPPSLDRETILLLTEVTLSLVLFVDASRIVPVALRRHSGIPIRLLAIALPLSIAVLTGVAMLLTGLGLGPALLIGASLAATDAALARVIVDSDRLPATLRRSINVESGLNDGLATPVVTVAIALTAMESGLSGGVVDVLLVPVAIAVAIGVVAGTVGGRALEYGRHRDLVDATFGQLVPMAVVGLAIAASMSTAAITFVAAFVAGLAFRQACGAASAEMTAFTEDAARLLTMAAFFLFGLVLVPTGLAAVSGVDVVIVAIALTVARMLPIAVSLLGSGLAWPTTAMIGWFGPRGLATVLFLLLAREELGDELSTRVVSVLVLAVVVSVVAHGASARPLSRRYAAWLDDMRDELAHEPAELSEEHLDVGRTRM